MSGPNPFPNHVIILEGALRAFLEIGTTPNWCEGFRHPAISSTAFGFRRKQQGKVDNEQKFHNYPCQRPIRPNKSSPMGSRFPAHQLSNGLYVSGRPEQPKEKAPTMSSTAMPTLAETSRNLASLEKCSIFMWRSPANLGLSLMLLQETRPDLFRLLSLGPAILALSHPQFLAPAAQTDRNPILGHLTSMGNPLRSHRPAIRRSNPNGPPKLWPAHASAPYYRAHHFRPYFLGSTELIWGPSKSIWAIGFDWVNEAA
uniref:Uncharacterized protein n=1 Tax=Ananas comosus var. bracteatus TaxID=296719 RepID=A0A6V7QBR1_ANACO|nr:unnamed protein product [Ananas comosus var. bracteatus]